MVGCSRQNLTQWMAAVFKVDLEAKMESMIDGNSRQDVNKEVSSSAKGLSDTEMNFTERSCSAAGAAVLSAVLVNPLDVAKTRLQAQAAGFVYSPIPRVGERMASLGPMFSEVRCSASCPHAIVFGAEPHCPPDCFQYKGTLDVFYKIIRQEGVFRLWRGTNAALALAVPTVGIYLPCYDIFRNWIEEHTESSPHLTPYAPLVAGSAARALACITCSPIELARTRMQAFKEIQPGIKPPGMWKTLVGVLSPVKDHSRGINIQSYRVLWTGVGAQLARDVPFSAICWSTLEPMRKRVLGTMDEEPSALNILGANFSAGFVAGSLAAAATCPLDVAKTRRQIEDPSKALKMTTLDTLLQIWRDGGIRGLYTGIGPRVGRAGPSVGIVVSFYEVVKHVLHKSQTT